MTYPAIIFLALLAWSFLWPKEDLIYLLFGSVAFGSLAVFPPAMMGGADLLPPALTAVVMTGRYVLDRGFQRNFLRNAFSPDRLGLFTAFMAVAFISALFFPKIFAGQVDVIQMRGGSGPLGPSPANLTQLAYLIVTYGAVLSIYSSAFEKAYVEKFLRAFIIGAAVLFLTGLADLALGGSGSSPLIAPFKTADYAILEGQDVLGMRRVVGFMSEASAYGPPCVVFGSVCLFCSSAIEVPRYKWAAIIVALGALGMGALSTSSTAFVGLGVFGVFYALNLSRRSLGAVKIGQRQSRRLVLIAEMFVLLFLFTIGMLVFVVSPDLFLTPAAFIDTLVFKKSLSSSYTDRMNWNRMAIEALQGTYGLGVGVGGARTSNWVVSVLSNTGFLGAAFLFGFIAYALLRPIFYRPAFQTEVVAGLRASIAIGLVMDALSGTAPDVGLSLGGLLAVVAANLPADRTARNVDASRQQASAQKLGGFRPSRAMPANRSAPASAAISNLPAVGDETLQKRPSSLGQRWQRRQDRRQTLIAAKTTRTRAKLQRPPTDPR